MKKILSVATIILLIIAVSLGYMWQSAARKASIADRNLAAAQDTMKRYVSDSVAAVSQMAFQREINVDSIAALNEALSMALIEGNQTARTLTETRFEFAQLQRSIEAGSDTITSSGERIANFPVEGPPIEGEVEVVVPADTTKSMTMEPNLVVTPFNMTYVIGCDEQHSAIVNIGTPDWVTTSISERIIDPSVCHPPLGASFGSFKLTTGGLAVGAGAGITIYTIIRALTGGGL